MLTHELLLATAIVVLVVLIHIVGLGVLVKGLRSHSILFRSLRIMPLTLLLFATLGIIALHTLEIWFYAAIYMWLGAFAAFEEALYFSTVTYASIGYGDMLLPVQWRILGAIEGPVGVVMLGLSTAMFVSLLSQLRLLRHDWLTRDDEL